MKNNIGNKENYNSGVLSVHRCPKGFDNVIFESWNIKELYQFGQSLTTFERL